MPGRVSSPASSARHPLLCTALLPGEGSMSQITDQGGGGPPLKTLRHFFPAQIFSAIQFTEPPHTQFTAARQRLCHHARSCRERLEGQPLQAPRHPAFSRQHKLIQGKNHPHVHNVELFSSSSSCRSKLHCVVRKGWAKGKQQGERKLRTTPQQLQQVRPNTKETTLGPV